MDVLKQLIQQFMPFAQKQMGFNRPPKLFLRQDAENAANPLGKTGFYDPQAESITLYVSGRHPKDILRSLSHELMHHTQKCNGDFDNVESQGMGEQGYAQNNAHMRTMEIQAYQASIVFRDWEDSLKETIYYEHLQKGDKKMSTKDWKNGELTTLLSEAWGFGFKVDRLNEEGGPGGVRGPNPEAAEEEKKELAGDEPKRLEQGNLEEDSGDKEKRDYEHDDWHDKDRLDAIVHHAEALRRDMDYDHDHEALEEDSGDKEKRDYEHDDWSDRDRLDAILHHAHKLREDMDYDHDHEALEEGGLADRPENAHRMQPHRGRRTEGLTIKEKALAAKVLKLMKEKKNG